MSIGLCLSGGGVKGAAHIGVIEALNEEGIKIDYISGASSGSIVAVLYAIGYNPFQMLDIFKSYCNNVSDFDKLIPFKIIGMVFTGRLKLRGLAKGRNLENIVKRVCSIKGVYDINDIKLPITISTVDIKTGEIVYFTNKENLGSRNFDDMPSYIKKGNISEIVRASCSVPCIFEPKYLMGRYLVDGGVRMNSPVSVLRKMGADKVITVNFDENKLEKGCNMNLVSVTLKSFDIMGHEVHLDEVNSSDFIINPLIGDVSLLDCNAIKYAANKGYEITKKNMPKIKEALGIK